MSSNSVSLSIDNTVQLATIGRVGQSGDTGKVEKLHNKLVSVRLNRKGLVTNRAAKNLYFVCKQYTILRKTKTKQKVQSGGKNTTTNKVLDKIDDDEQEESQYLGKVLSLEQLSNEYVIIYKNNTCNLQVQMICKGNISDKEWPTFIDCILNDY